MIETIFLVVASIIALIYISVMVKISKGDGGGAKTITCFSCSSNLGVISRKPLRLGCLNPECSISDKKAIKKIKKELNRKKD